MNILTICQFYYPENFTITPLMRQLVAQGHQVTVVTGRPNAGFGYVLPEYRHLKFEIIDGVKVHRLPIIARKPGRLGLLLNYFSYYFLAKAFVRRHKGQYDVVFGMSLSPVISIAPAVLFSKRHKLPLLLYCVDIWPESAVYTNYIVRDSLAYRYLKWWSGRLYRAANHILVGSPSYQTYMMQEHAIDSNRLDVLVQPALVTKLDAPARTYQGRVNLVYIGNIGQVQLLEELVAAVARFQAADVHLHLIGSGTKWNDISQYIQTHHLETCIHHYGTMPSGIASQFFPNADALIVSLKEGGYVGKTIPNKLMMYLGFGRPIIGALTGDGATILTASGGGILVPPTEDGLVAGIEHLLSLSNQEKNALGALNKAYFEQHFTLEKIAKQLEHYLSKLIN